MPLIYKRTITPDTILGIWEIEENIQLEDYCPQSVCDSTSTKNKARRKETAAVYALLHSLYENDNLVISHELTGKPYLAILVGNGEKRHIHTNISISHTDGFAAIILSASHKVSIDIEYMSSRIERIKERFLRHDELNDIHINTKNTEKREEGIKQLLLYWCSKETVFKLFSDNHLTFQNMKVQPIQNIEQNGTIICRNMLQGENCNIIYTITDRYAITYCVV